MLRNLADTLNSFKRTTAVVERKYPAERVQFATAVTLLETTTSQPVGWSLRRLLQRRGNAVFTDRRVFVQSSFVSPLTALWVVAIVVFGIQFVLTRQFLDGLIAMVGAVFIWQRRPYERSIEYDQIKKVQFGGVRGIGGRGDIVAFQTETDSLHIVTAQFVPEGLKRSLGVSMPTAGA